MLHKIAKSYRRNARLSRKEFLLGLILFMATSFVVFSIYSYAISIETYQTKYLIGKSILELILYIAMMPIFAARLKDMNWPTYLVLFLVPMWLFTTRNLVIYMNLNDIEHIRSPLILYAESGLGIIFLAVLGCMLLFRSASNNANAVDAKKRRT